jgi:hypothetical protein
MRARHKRVAFWSFILIAIVGTAAWFFTRDPQTQRQLLDQGERAGLVAKIEAEKATLAMYQGYLVKIDEWKKSGVSQENYQGYDAFSYDKEADYVKAAQESERRLGDLQSRLNSAYDR